MLPRRGVCFVAAIASSSACVVPLGSTEVADLELLPPEISDIDIVCDVDKGAWTIDLVATAWTGAAELIWTDDGEYVEFHTFQSVAAAPKGKRDQLILEMSVAVDWRVNGNGTTAFTCAHEPSVLVTVADLDGVVSDCARFGNDPDLVAMVPDVPECDQLWESLIIE
jgi:hypothetical protein